MGPPAGDRHAVVLYGDGMRCQTAAVVIAAALALLAMGACGRPSGKAGGPSAPAASSGRQEVADGGATPPTEGGSTSAGTTATMPVDFPKAIPLYPGAKVLVATRGETLGKPAWAATLETRDARDAVAAFYRSGLGAFQRKSAMRMGDTDMSVWQGPDYDLTLMLTASAEETTVINLSAARK